MKNPQRTRKVVVLEDKTYWNPLEPIRNVKRTYLSMMTGSEGVSFLLPQLFLSQHRLKKEIENVIKNAKESIFGNTHTSAFTPD